MEYTRSRKYEKERYISRMMGPNPLKLAEELMEGNRIARDSYVMDLGSGEGITSLFLRKEYGFRVTAADLWSDEGRVSEFFVSEGESPDVLRAVHADAVYLPFGKEEFDAVVSVDSYNYFGRDEGYLDSCLLPFIRKGGLIYLAITAARKDMRPPYPDCIMLSWNEEQMEYIRGPEYWKAIFSACKGAELEELSVMESNEEVWADWLRLDNPYAKGDKAAIENGALEHLCFLKAVLRKK